MSADAAALADGASQIDLDLAGITFMDCAGISALVTARNHARRHGARLRVTKASRAVRRVLELTGLLAELNELN